MRYLLLAILIGQSTCLEEGCDTDGDGDNGSVTGPTTPTSPTWSLSDCGNPNDGTGVCNIWRGIEKPSGLIDPEGQTRPFCQTACAYASAEAWQAVYSTCQSLNAFPFSDAGFDLGISTNSCSGAGRSPGRWNGAADLCAICDEIPGYWP